jgi:ubiquitin carboxyl-terminal hydrolase 9/24
MVVVFEMLPKLKVEFILQGQDLSLTVQFLIQGRQPKDFEIFTHSNEMLATVRRHILNRIEGENMTSVLATAAVNPTMIQQQGGSGASQQAGLKLNLYLNYELIEPSEGSRLEAELLLRDKTVGRSFQFVRLQLQENVLSSTPS